MFKNFKSISLSMAVVIALIGCDDSSNPTTTTETLPKVSQELKTLVKSPRSTKENLENIPTATQGNGNPPEEETKNCTNGGTMNFTSDFNQTAIANSPNDFNITLTSKAIDCIESGMTINGEIETKIHMSSQKSIMMKYLTDFNITDGSTLYTIKKDSTIMTVIISSSMDENITENIENIEIISDDESYESVDLKYIKKELANGGINSYNISGKEIVNGVTFIVDESYDAKLTPVVEDSEGNILKGAKELYTNDQNHSITVEAIEKNKIQLSVDTDRDGKADQLEEISL